MLPFDLLTIDHQVAINLSLVLDDDYFLKYFSLFLLPVTVIFI